MFSASIAWRLFGTSASRVDRGNNREKLGVTGITMLTTFVYVILELPAIGLFINAAISGSNVVHSTDFMCRWQLIAHFLAICEASVLFFIYVTFR